MQIALLRGINVGGHNKVAMSTLRALFADLGLVNVTTLLQSGNFVFQSDRLAGAALERRLEKESAKRLALPIDYIVRGASQWAEIVARNPFPQAARDDPSHLVVMCLKAAPKSADVEALQASIRGPEIVRCVERQLYIVYPAGIGRSKLTGAAIESQLDVRGTARNWNTVLKLLEVCKGTSNAGDGDEAS